MRLASALSLPRLPLRPLARKGEHLANQALDGKTDVRQARVIVHIGRCRNDTVLLVDQNLPLGARPNIGAHYGRVLGFGTRLASQSDADACGRAKNARRENGRQANEAHRPVATEHRFKQASHFRVDITDDAFFGVVRQHVGDAVPAREHQGVQVVVAHRTDVVNLAAGDAGCFRQNPSRRRRAVG